MIEDLYVFKQDITFHNTYWNYKEPVTFQVKSLKF